MKKCIFILAIFFATQGQGEPSDLIKNLVQMRSEIEVMGKDVDMAQKEKQAQLDFWLQKRQELQNSIQKEELRSLQVQERERRLNRKMGAVSGDAGPVRAEFKQEIEAAKEWLKTSIPFAKEERTSRLQVIEERFNKGLDPLESLAADLWSFYETELKYGGQNEFRIMDVKSGEKTERAEIVRLGLFAMYVKPLNAAPVEYVQKDGEWLAQAVNPNSQSEVLRLIANFREKNRAGVYSIPMVTMRGEK